MDQEGLIKEVKVSRGEVISLPSITKEGYTFSGWYDEDKKLGESAWFNKSSVITAKWEPIIQMTITYDTDGGESIEPMTIYCDKPFVFPKPVKKDYTFKGWVDDNGNVISNESELDCIDITLKATWEKRIINDDYTSTDLTETLNELKLEKKYRNYTPNEDAITIYLFYGDSCIHCHHFLEFLSSIADEYGKYFNLKAYEVWQDEKNHDLMDSVSDYLGKPAGGVPYIVIGKTAINGYGESSGDRIKQAIKELYDTKKEERYDVLDEINKKSD